MAKKKAKVKQGTPEEIAERMEKVEFGLLHGYSCRRLAEELEMSVRQVERYRSKIKKTNLELFRKSSPEERLSDLHYDIRAIRDQAMKLASSAKTDSAKVGALHVLQRQVDSKFNQYKDLGYIDVMPQKHEITGSLTVQQIIGIGRQVKQEKKKKKDK